MAQPRLGYGYSGSWQLFRVKFGRENVAMIKVLETGNEIGYFVQNGPAEINKILLECPAG